MRSSPANLAGCLPPGSRVYVQGGALQPDFLLENLCRHRPGLRDIEFVSVGIPGINTRDLSALGENCRQTLFLFDEKTFSAEARSRTHLVREHYHAIPRLLQKELRPDVALIQVAPGSNRSYFLSGPGSDFMPALISSGARLIAQCNSRVPACQHSIPVPASRIEHIVSAEAPLLETAPGQLPDETSRKIGRYVAELIPDGATLQTGIGRMPGAVLAALHTHRDLGLHSGLITPPVAGLIDSGAINGKRKSIDRGLHIAGTVLGDAALYEWCNGRRDLHLRPVTYTHDHRVLASLDRLFALNGALQIDLEGNINAERIGGLRRSGTGGLVDFMRGAKASRGGRAITVVAATRSDGRHSTIVPRLDHADALTVTGCDSDTVVTEYGIADLRGRSGIERARALIDVAHPRFRRSLEDAWSEQQRGSYDNHSRVFTV